MKTNIKNEFGKLKKIIVATTDNVVSDKFSDDYLEKFGHSMAREIRYHPETDLVDVGLARVQHSNFLKLLESKGIELIFPKNIKDATDQIFTRDIGFVIGDTFYYSSMGDEIRKIEQAGIEHLNFSKSKKLKKGIVEGGDVIVDGKNIFVGITIHSTSWQGFETLKEEFEPRGYNLISIECKDNVLHLDCRFTVIAPNLALIFEDDIFERDLRKIKNRFDTINLKKEEVLSYGTNVFLISPNEIVSDARNKRINRILESKGFQVHKIDYSEITKMWGAFRCTTLPLERV